MKEYKSDAKKDMDVRLKTNTWYSQSEIIGMVFNILLIANELYINSLVHLDIKWNNILIDEEGNLILIDYGTSIKMKVPLNIIKYLKGCSLDYVYKEFL